jgi:hypothetical protein
MSRFSKMAKALNLDLRDWNCWMDAQLKPNAQHRKLWDAYDRSLRRIELFEERFEVWVMVNVDSVAFEQGYKIKDKRLRELERASVAVLEQIFRAYRQDRGSGK